MRKEKRKLVLLGFFLLLDRISKFVALKYGLALVNKGISFGIILPLSLIIMAALIAIFLVVRGRFGLSGGMIVGGGVSNLIDRIIYNGAVDFIKFPFISVFNLADVLIVSGVMIFLVDLSRSRTVS